ncbi:MAG: restriction endonuclease subunit S [Balneola sp.]|nr:restriction endonuclease subunit S [Balneola sp.]
MNKLKRHKFSDLYEISSGISSKKEQAGHGAPFLSFSTVFNNHFIPDKLDEKMDTSEEEQEKYSIKEGDIFLTRTSETLDELGMSSVALKDYQEATYSGFLKRLRPKQNEVTYHKYLAFYLRGYLFRKSMNYKAVMTLRASLNEKIFSYLDLLLPEYSQQKKIGDFLYLIEEKIELNKKINNELESLIKLISNYWFVQYNFPDNDGNPFQSSGGEMVFNNVLKRRIPANWKVMKLSEFAEIEKGDLITAKTADLEGKVKVVSAGIEPSYNHSVPNRKENTITVSASGANAGFVNFWREPIFACDCTTIRGASDAETLILKEFLEMRQEYIFSQAKGSAQPHVYPKDIGALQMAIPPKRLIRIFGTVVVNANMMIVNNISQIKELIELRDWLLPMLINGEITVKEAEEELNIAAEPDTEYKATKKPTNVDYYRRTVLAAEIVWQLHQQPTLGHVKLQKIIYLAKQTSSMMLPTNFLKQAAGPYDPKMARSIDKQLKKNKWFEFQKDEFPKYKPLENAGEHKADFNRYFHEEKENIQFFIDTFKKAKTDKVEIIATLYACWKELTEKDKTVTDDVLIEQFYNWSEEKAKFKHERLLKAINWMRDKGVYPVS